MSDEYRTVEAILRQRRANAIMVENPRRQGWLSVPRSVLHGGDNMKIDRDGGIGEKITFRMRAWKAEELGLAGPE